jgi:hypothetical protein
VSATPSASSSRSHASPSPSRSRSDWSAFTAVGRLSRSSTMPSDRARRKVHQLRSRDVAAARRGPLPVVSAGVDRHRVRVGLPARPGQTGEQQEFGYPRQRVLVDHRPPEVCVVESWENTPR